MAEFINREKLLKRMEGYCKANCGCKPYEDALCPSCGLGDAIYMVEEQRIVNIRNMKGRKDAIEVLSKKEKTTPAADVRPVVKAKIVDMRYTEDDGEWKCSRCGWQFTLCMCGKDVTRKIHFCPNCGADMREEN